MEQHIHTHTYNRLIALKVKQAINTALLLGEQIFILQLVGVDKRLKSLLSYYADRTVFFFRYLYIKNKLFEV